MAAAGVPALVVSGDHHPAIEAVCDALAIGLEGEREEAIGMDIVQHGEEAYVTGEGAILITPEGDQDGRRAVAQPV